jgi:predicted secreted Zn-dependent protease
MHLFRPLPCTTALCVLLCLSAAAEAKSQNTKYRYYTIGGSSVDGVYKEMLRRGPHVGGGKAYASTKMDPQVEAVTANDGDRCRIASFKINMTFTINLPKLQGSSALDASTRRSFDNFLAFARKHEERHRSIWLGCAAQAEAQIKNVSAATCGQAEAKGLAIMQKVANACDRKHAAFDASEQTKLAKHPFIRAVMARGKKVPRNEVALPAAVLRKKNQNF